MQFDKDFLASARNATEQLMEVIERSRLDENKELMRGFRRLQGRTSASQWTVAVVADSHQVKSSFLHSLLGASLEAARVVQGLASCTYLGYGAEPECSVTLANGLTARLPLEQLKEFLQEKTPVFGLLKVVVRVPNEVLRSGMVVVDTPELSAAAQPVTGCTQASMQDAEACVFVTSVAAGLSPTASAFLHAASDQLQKMFIVLVYDPALADPSFFENSVHLTKVLRFEYGLDSTRIVTLPTSQPGAASSAGEIQDFRHNLTQFARARSEEGLAEELRRLSGETLFRLECARGDQPGPLQSVRLRRAAHQVAGIVAALPQPKTEASRAVPVAPARHVSPPPSLVPQPKAPPPPVQEEEVQLYDDAPADIRAELPMEVHQLPMELNPPVDLTRPPVAPESVAPEAAALETVAAESVVPQPITLNSNIPQPIAQEVVAPQPMEPASLVPHAIILQPATPAPVALPAASLDPPPPLAFTPPPSEPEPTVVPPPDLLPVTAESPATVSEPQPVPTSPANRDAPAARTQPPRSSAGRMVPFGAIASTRDPAAVIAPVFPRSGQNSTPAIRHSGSPQARQMESAAVKVDEPPAPTAVDFPKPGAAPNPENAAHDAEPAPLKVLAANGAPVALDEDEPHPRHGARTAFWLGGLAVAAALAWVAAVGLPQRWHLADLIPGIRTAIARVSPRPGSSPASPAADPSLAQSTGTSGVAPSHTTPAHGLAAAPALDPSRTGQEAESISKSAGGQAQPDAGQSARLNGASSAQSGSSQQLANLTDESSSTTDLIQDPSLQYALDRWASTYRSGNIRAQVSCYAPFVDNYFNLHNVRLEQVERDKADAWSNIAAVHEYRVKPLRVTDDGNGQKTVLLQKDWNTTTRRGTKWSGSEVEKLVFVKIDSSWKIVDEQEMKLLRLHRE